MALRVWVWWLHVGRCRLHVVSTFGDYRGLPWARSVIIGGLLGGFLGGIWGGY